MQWTEPKAGMRCPDLSAIPRWRGKKRDGSAFAFLKAHYSQWLAAFGAPEDRLFQDQLRRHDKKLVQGLINELREEGQGRQLRDFVKPRSARIDQELENVTIEDILQTPRLAATLYTRQRRAQQGTHVRRDTVIPQWFQASKAAAASDGHAVHC